MITLDDRSVPLHGRVARALNELCAAEGGRWSERQAEIVVLATLEHLLDDIDEWDCVTADDVIDVVRDLLLATRGGFRP